MPRVLLIHWNEEEACARAKELAKLGIETVGCVWQGGEVMKTLRRSEGVEAIVISLERMPSHGRIVGAHLRQVKSTRNIPLVYVEGPDAEKVERVRATLPDAMFTKWAGVKNAIKRAKALDEPVVPRGGITSNRPVREKLGIKERMRIGVHGAPEEFEELLGEIPEGVTFQERGKCDLWFWFVRSDEELISELDFMSLRSPLWICWPKGVGELKQPLIREAARAVGMVDYKICSVSKTWSGMLFRVKEKRTR